MDKEPHFLLFSRTSAASADGVTGGSWHFQLESTTSGSRFEAADLEPEVSSERLELLSVVRGLEALAQPSRVTLITASRYVSSGIRKGLEQWRQSDWTWERYGAQVPIKNEDLWRRIDRALRIHRVDCRRVRWDPPHANAAPAQPTTRSATISSSVRRWRFKKLTSMVMAAVGCVGCSLAGALHRTADWLQNMAPENHAKPHPQL